MTATQLAAPGAAECVRVFPGEFGQVRAARMFVARVLAGSPAQQSLLTCVTELAANAVEHTESGRGGVFTVAVGRPASGVAFVAVTDEGGGEEPSVHEAEDFAEGGRGLALVAACSSRWGVRDTPPGRTVWAEVTWPVAVPAQRDGQFGERDGQFGERDGQFGERDDWSGRGAGDPSGAGGAGGRKGPAGRMWQDMHTNTAGPQGVA